jgi:delta24-sterol reductase
VLPLCFSLFSRSATEQPELFYAVPWSHGTLGFLTAVTLQIIPAKPYVKVKYCPYHSLEPALTAFEKESRKGEAFDHATGKVCKFRILERV